MGDVMSNEWQYKLLKGLSALVCKLSYSTVLSVGKGLGPIYGIIAKKQKKRGIRNAMIGMNMTEREAEKLMDDLFAHLGQAALEMLYMPNLTKEFIEEHVEIIGLDNLEEALAEDKGVIVLTAHVGNWEWMGAALASYGYPSTTIVKKQPNAQFTRLLNEYREAAGLEVFARGGSEIVKAAKALKKKKMLGFLADQDGNVQGLPVEFLGQMSSAVLGPATFAHKFDSPIIPMFAARKENGYHEVYVLPMMRYVDTGNEEEDMYRLTEECVKVTEDFIRQHPKNWVWFQHRWNTKPNQIEDFERKMAVRESVHAKK